MTKDEVKHWVRTICAQRLGSLAVIHVEFVTWKDSGERNGPVAVILAWDEEVQRSFVVTYCSTASLTLSKLERELELFCGDVVKHRPAWGIRQLGVVPLLTKIK